MQWPACINKRQQLRLIRQLGSTQSGLKIESWGSGAWVVAVPSLSRCQHQGVCLCQTPGIASRWLPCMRGRPRSRSSHAWHSMPSGQLFHCRPIPGGPKEPASTQTMGLVLLGWFEQLPCHVGQTWQVPVSEGRLATVTKACPPVLLPWHAGRRHPTSPASSPAAAAAAAAYEGSQLRAMPAAQTHAQSRPCSRC